MNISCKTAFCKQGDPLTFNTHIRVSLFFLYVLTEVVFQCQARKFSLKPLPGALRCQETTASVLADCIKCICHRPM